VIVIDGVSEGKASKLASSQTMLNDRWCSFISGEADFVVRVFVSVLHRLQVNVPGSCSVLAR
jgi:hypothetical protein